MLLAFWGMTMRRFNCAALAAVAAIGFASVACGADMPMKAAPMVAPVAAYNWTGFYIGGNIGYSWGNASGVVNVTGLPASLPTSYSGSANPDGIIGGGQIGYNWQANNWVFGLEADFQGSAEKATGSATSDPFTFSSPFAQLQIPGTLNQSGGEASILWFGTVRGRIGMLVTPTILLYGTGGLAYGRISGSDTVTINLGAPPTTVFSSAYGNSATNLGWTLGAGVEGAFPNTSNWTWKLEYLYIDLGSVGSSGSVALPAPFVGTYGYSWSTKITDNIVRVGLNYRFH
jgi:outer membrane immunogenic protein